MIGKQFKPHWAWEFAYLDAGEAGLGNANPALAAEVPNAAIAYDIPSLFFNYSPQNPNHDFSYFAKLGVSLIDNNANDSRIPFDRQSTLQLAFGVGAQWRFAQRWFLRAEYDSYDRDANYLGIFLGTYLDGHEQHEQRNSQ